MSAYDPYDVPIRERERDRDYSRRYYTSDRDRRERPEPRYADVQDPHYRVNLSSRTELVPRAREDSDLSVEEIRRDFPPPGSSRDIRRARSAEPGYDDYYYDQRRQYDTVRDRDRDRAYRPHKKPGSVYYEEEERARKRVLSKQDKIIAAVVGGVVAAGAKELWDRHEAKEEGSEVHRNIAASAALGAAGAFAGYQGADLYNKHATKEGEKKSTYIVHKSRDGRVVEYYSDDEEDPRGHKGNKSFLENALSAAGLGGAIKALTGGGSDKDDRRSDGRSRRGSPDSRRSRSKSQDTPAARMQKAAKASLVAGAAEAFRVSKEPGNWKGEKMKRVLTAAAGAATIDAALDPSKDSKRHLLESVIGGLVGNRVLHGSRKDIEEDARTGRSRSRSRARSDGGAGGKGGLAALATAGLGVLGAKKIMDRSRSRSRSRRGSPDSYNSRDRSPRRYRSRSRSIVDGARRSLAKIGIGSGPEDPRDDDYYDDRSSRRSRHRSPDDRYHDDDDYTSRGYMRGGRGDDYRDDRSAGGKRRSRSAQRGGRSSVSSSDLGDSEDDEKMARKMRGKQLLKAGLATVATIHAVHGVYGSMGARNARHKAVKEGRLSPAEAKKLKTKAILQDAASVGIAAFTIQGAVQELKEAQEQTKQVKEWQQEKKRRHERRMERLKRANSNHYARSRADNWSTSAPAQSRRYDDDGPRYTDGNPYSAALPAPPVGYEER
ncbi:hypothetical protein DL769_005883 [Monosporascus sp. CRB-8-3]|nr:hypothetical protein DL769_005883 [Monosporascus sp. CRB-8-3]